MTTMYEKEVECSVCGETCNLMFIGSTSAYGSGDLDTRPPEMKRSAIHGMVQRCPSCGYCSNDLLDASEKTKEIVNSKDYQDILKNESIPKVASSFLALSYEKEQMHEYSESAWRAIHAAWVSDDKNNPEASLQCRKRAIHLIEKAQSQQQTIADQEGVSELITIDLMRRAGMFQEALKLAKSIQPETFDDVINHAIQFELSLIEKKDILAHTISEALGEK